MKKFLILFFLFFIPSVYAEEVISDFSVGIRVNKNASIDVTEVIQINAEGNIFRHGLLRKLPRRYVDSYKISHHTDYQLGDILVNDLSSSFHTEENSDALSVYIGSKDNLLSPGSYSYTIHYHVKNALNYFKDADEIYWNITGNEWQIPILHAQAVIQLPEGAVIEKEAAYTGRMGARNKDFVMANSANNKLVVETTKRLEPGEGLTVAASFQKGIIIPPTWWQSIIGNFGKTEQMLLAILLAILCVNWLMWDKYGRDPKQKSIIPLFEPPENLTPEAMRYILNMGYDAQTFTAAIVSMATKKYLVIVNDENKYTLKRTDKNIQLPAEEAALGNVLFQTNNEILLEPANASLLNQAKKKLKQYLTTAYKNKYFMTNFSRLIPGIVLSLLALGLFYNHKLLDVVQIIFWCYIVYFYFPRLILSLKLARASKTSATIITALFNLFLFIIFFIVLIVSIVEILVSGLPLITLSLILLIFICNAIFYYLLKAPTPEGSEVMAKIKGFRLFLSTTERYRLNQWNAPEVTPELFEKYMPYAIALDVESQWRARFEDVMQKAGINPAQYQSAWYVSDIPWNSSNISALPVIIGLGLASSVASASDSSSGSGSSGGGGGGGGGGGW